MTHDFFLAEAAKALASHPRKDELLVELALWLGPDDGPPSGEARLSARQVFADVSRAIIETNAPSAVAILGGLASRVRPWIVLAETIAWCSRVRREALSALDPSVLDTNDAEAHVSRVVEERARLLDKKIPQPRFERGLLVGHDPDRKSEAPPTDTWLEWRAGKGKRLLLAWVPDGYDTDAIPLASAVEYAPILPAWVLQIAGR